MQPDVSIIIAAHNAELFIGDAVASATHQTVQNIEIIVIDDASTDGTLAVATSLAAKDDRIRCLALQVNSGPSAARNAGIRASRGKWVAVLDADDRIESCRTERLLALAEATSADIVANNLLIIRTQCIAKSYPAFISGDDPYYFTVSPEEYVRRNTVLTRGFKLGYLKPIFRRDLLQDNAISYNENVRLGEDYLFCLSALMTGARFVVTSEPLYKYYARAGSLSSKLQRKDIEVLIQTQEQIILGLDESELSQELSRSNSHLGAALVFTHFLDQVKRKRLLSAASLAVLTPRIWRHILRSGSEAANKRLWHRFT